MDVISFPVSSCGLNGPTFSYMDLKRYYFFIWTQPCLHFYKLNSVTLMLPYMDLTTPTFLCSILDQLTLMLPYMDSATPTFLYMDLMKPKHRNPTMCLIWGNLFLPLRDDLSLPCGSLVVSWWSSSGIRLHRQHSGPQDGAAHVHGVDVPDEPSIPLPKSRLLARMENSKWNILDKRLFFTKACFIFQ